jgi:hypothetical protein
MTEPAKKERVNSEAVDQKSTMLTEQVLWVVKRTTRCRKKRRKGLSPTSSSNSHEAAACRCMQFELAVRSYDCACGVYGELVAWNPDYFEFSTVLNSASISMPAIPPSRRSSRTFSSVPYTTV